MQVFQICIQLCSLRITMENSHSFLELFPNFMFHLSLFQSRTSNLWTPQVRLINAAKARLIRWCKPKSKRKDRVAPEIVKAEWEKGNKATLAALFSQLNFNQDWVWCECVVLHVPAISSHGAQLGTRQSQIVKHLQEEFVNQLIVIVSKKQKVTMTIDEGWYSESEMLTDLQWSQF